MSTKNGIKKMILMADELSKRTQELLKSAKSRLQKSPSDFLYTTLIKGKYRYYSREEGTNSARKSLCNNPEEIKMLEEKYYYEKLVKTAENELEALVKIRKILERCPDTDSVFFELPESKRHLICPLDTLSDENRVRHFRQIRGERRVANSNFRTLNGEYVRSKSELIIADRLKVNDIPYHYELGALMDDAVEVWHPDFIVMNKRTGRTYYWEHFGMIDNAEYCSSFQYKLERYAKKDIFPGEDLIITTESSGHILDTGYIDLVINHYLI